MGAKTYCEASGTDDFASRPYSGGSGTLAKCDRCGRVLKPTKGGKLRQHQVKGRTTASMDKTMDTLWDMTGCRTVTITAEEGASVLQAAQEAQDAACGDSNDEEIDLLRGALEQALGLLELKLPEGRDPFDELPEHRFNPAPFCAKCGGPCEMEKGDRLDAS